MNEACDKVVGFMSRQKNLCGYGDHEIFIYIFGDAKNIVN